MVVRHINTIRGYRSIRLVNPTTVRFELYLRPTTQQEEARVQSLATTAINLRVYSDWQHGATGAATYEEVNAPIQASIENDNLGHAFIQLDITINQVKIFNDCDRISFQYLGHTYICSITQPEYLVQSGVRSYINQSFNAYTLNPILNATVDELANNQVRVSTNHGFPLDVASLYLDSITGLTMTSTSDYPRIFTGARDVGTLSGAYGSTVNLVLNYKVGGAKSGNTLPLHVVLTRRPGTTTSPNVPDLSATKVLITNVQSEHEGEITVEFEITPTLTATSGGEIRLQTDQTMPVAQSLGRSTTTNLLRTSITRAGLQRGRSYKAVITYRKSATESYASPPVYFKYGETLQLMTDVEHLIQRVRNTKVFVDDITISSAKFDLVNDLFLTDFVKSVYVEFTVQVSKLRTTVENTNDSSILSLTRENLPINGKVPITVGATTDFGEIEIGVVKVKTLMQVRSNSVAADTATNSRRTVFARAYDADILDIVEGLPIEAQNNLAIMEYDRLNNPENDGYVHDFNRHNKRGAIFGKTVSDLAKTKTTEVIDFALGDISTTVPDIDAGAPA